MHTRVVKPKHGPELIVRPLRSRETATVQAVFDRLGNESRRRRFNGDGDPEPVAIARLVRSGGSAEIAFEVADAYHGRGIGSALTQELVMDACAAGVVEVTALVRSENRAALAILSRVLGPFELRFEGPEMIVRAPLPARS
jgi:RimJ/RimL family protein N-acetyltransferase